MEEDDVVQELERNYLKHFHDHVSWTSNHLLGRVEEQLLPPSHILPTGYWTPAEKDLFFHALCIHSRLRPDLIVADIKTKTLFDVCLYLDALEAGAAEYRNEEDEVDEDENGGEDDDEEDIGAFRKALPFAMEVTDNWVEFEESQAGLIAEEEERWEVLLLKKRNRETLDDLRAQTESESEETDSLLFEEELRQKREKVFRNLKKDDLIAMDRMLREREENAAKPKDNSNGTFKTTRALSASEPMSRTQLMTPPLTQSPPSVSRPPTPVPEVDPVTLLSPTSRRRYQKRLYMRRKRAENKGTEVNKTVMRLKPGRKSDKPAQPPPNKRRKRNEDAHIGDDDEMEEVNLDQENGSDDDDAESKESSPSPSEKKKKTKTPGLTAPYKSLSKFAKLGIDASTICEHGLELFYLARLEKLVQMYCGLHDVPEKTVTAISSSLLRYFSLLIVNFVTDAVHKAVVSHEQEQLLKNRTKVWRTSDTCLIDTASVGHALELMGVSCFDKRDFFRELTSRLDLDDTEGGIVSLQDEQAEDRVTESTSKIKVPGTTGEKDGLPDFSAEPALLLPPSLHREIYQPVVRLPKYFTDLKEEDMEELGSVDEDAFTGELEDESELNELDEEEEGRNEEALWRGNYQAYASAVS